MSECPVCHQQIQILEQHHGTLMTCSHCKAVFFVGWNGTPEAAPAEVAAPENFPPSPQEIPVMDNPVEASPPVMAATEAVSEASDNPWQVPENTNPSAFADVVNFGNSTQDQGLLTYDLLIEGIDLKNHRQDLKDCLTDQRFRWNADDYISQIKDGKLKMNKVPAVKMMVLVRRLKAYPFKISWRQSALTA